MEKSKVKEIMEWFFCIIIALVIALLFRYFVGTPTIVRQESMKPTLIAGQRLWLNRLGRTTKTLPNRGDIITFEAPAVLEYTETEIENMNEPIAKYEDVSGFKWFFRNFLEIGKKSYMKRVIGLPGEHIQIKDGKVYVNNEILEESYLSDGLMTTILTHDNCGGFDDFVVPNNCVFAMGDNRNASMDCRVFGCIPLEKIEGTVAIRIWPLNKWGKI